MRGDVGHTAGTDMHSVIDLWYDSSAGTINLTERASWETEALTDVRKPLRIHQMCR